MRTAMLTLLVIAMAAASVSAQLTAAVREHAGHPTLLINDQPTSPLIFFGSVFVGGRPTTVDVGPEWKQYSLTFRPTADDDHASIHVHLGAELGGPGDVWLDGIALCEGEAPGAGPNLIPGGDFEEGQEGFDRDWVFFLRQGDAEATARVEGEQAASGRNSLHIHIEKPGTIDFAVHIFSRDLSVRAGQAYTLSAFMRSTEARRATLFLVHQGDPWNVISGDDSPALKEIGLAGRNGFHLHSFSLPLPWAREGEAPDYAGVDTVMQAVLAQDPEALCIPRFGMSPPGWWFDQHPDDRMRFGDATGDTQFWESPASELWRHDACEALRQFVRYLEEHYGDHVFGYHPCGQHTGEWFYQESWTPKLHGFDRATGAGFRRWLETRYGTDAALQQAWRDPAVTLAAAAVPTVEQRLAPGLGLLRDPLTDRRVTDFHEYLSLAMEEPLEQFARVIKEETNRRKVVCFFYGYFFDMCGVPRGPAATGHFAMGRLLRCPDVDIICSPISYFDRDLVGSGPFMSAIDSQAPHGKLWLNEDDTRTYLSEAEDPYSRVSTPQETFWVHQRNFGQIFTRRCATWWMDLPGTGWLLGQDIWDHLKPLRAIYDANLEQPAAYAPEIAVIVDEASIFQLSANNTLSNPLLYVLRQQLNRIGAPVGYYYLQDLAEGHVPRTKLYVFLNALTVPAEVRTRVLTQVERPGATSLWLYAARVLGENGFDPAGSEALTGIKLAVAEGVAAPRIVPAGKLAQSLGGTQPFGTDAPVAPLFAAVPGPGIEPLGTWEGTNLTAAAQLEHGGARSVFVGSLTVPAALLRGVAREAGVHLYLDTDDHVVSDGRYLFVHAVTAGEKRVALPRPAKVTDALTGEALATGDQLTLTMEAGETRVILTEPN